MFAFKALFLGMWDYVIVLPEMSLTVFSGDGVEDSVATKLAGWQGGWTTFYWAWWIAFAPFVGLFLARISKGRTIREYVLGAMIGLSIMCFVWFAFAGGTAIDLSLMLSPTMATLMSIFIVVLLLTYLVTSAESAVLIINTIAAAGDESPKGRIHIVVWGVILTLVIAGLLLAGGLGAINTAMIIGALPFSVVMALMGLSLIKALWNDGRRSKE